MIAFDMETEPDPRRPSGQALTVASVVDIDAGRLRQFDRDSSAELLAVLLLAERVIGFNLIAFDLRVLSDDARRDLTQLPSARDLYRDLWQRTGRNDISLDELARGTLGRAELSHGGDLYSRGQMRRLREASASGTREIAALWRFGAANQFVRWLDDASGRLFEIPVQWS